MPSQGPSFPTAATTALYLGSGTDWSNPTYILADDTNYATVVPNTYSRWLVGTAFGFAIPAGSTIDGITATINRKGQYNDTRYLIDTAVNLTTGGAVKGSDYADLVTHWPTALEDKTYGGATDKWGTTWTAEEVNANDFGLQMSVTRTSTSNTASVDYYKITVYYTPPGGGVKFCAVLSSKVDGVVVSKFDGVT